MGQIANITDQWVELGYDLGEAIVKAVSGERPESGHQHVDSTERNGVVSYV